MSSKHIFLALVLVSWAIPGKAAAMDGVKLYASPAVGVTWLKIKSIEIEKSFISFSLEDDTVDEDRVVGAKAFYTGSGVTPAVSAGIKLFDLGLGFHFSYTAMKTNKGKEGDRKTGGYFLEYRYSAEIKGAVGEKNYDEGTIGLKHILFELWYGLPIWRFELVFTTRIGGVMVDPGELQLGRAVKTKNGIAGNIGARLEVYVLDFMGIGIGGFGGFFAFSGAYEGTYGGGGGFNANITFRI